LTLAAGFCAAALLGGCSRPAPSTPARQDRAATTAPAQVVADDNDETAGLMNLRLGDRAVDINDPIMVADSWKHVAADDEPYKANDEKDRAEGPAGKVYLKVAPAVVVVKTRSGHGTGSIISEDGWVITNHHVIAKALPEGRALILTGTMGDDAQMKLNDRGLPAVIHYHDKAKDLALLKIVDTNQKFPYISFAKKNAEPTDMCVAIGHPKSGLLWTIREGKIAGGGYWPFDGVNSLNKRVAASAGEKVELQNQLKQVQIFLSNCGINYGDSGGPLLNADGDMIAVTFAMPTEAGTASFAYHIHLDEVKAFKDRAMIAPATAPETPDAWPAGAYLDLFDLDGDGTPDALGIANTKGGALTGLMFDLLQQNNIKTVGDLADQPRKWKFNVALHFKPQMVAYYDTHGKGGIDLVMARSGKSVQIRRLEKGGWAAEDSDQRPLLDPNLVEDRTARERLARIAKALQDR